MSITGINVPVSCELIATADNSAITTGTVSVFTRSAGGSWTDTTSNATYDATTGLWYADVAAGSSDTNIEVLFKHDSTAHYLAPRTVPVYNPTTFKATGFSTHSAADVWSAGTRTLTAFGFTSLDIDDAAILSAISGLNDLGASDIRTAVGLASANLDTQIGGLDAKIDTIDGIVDAILIDTAEIENLNNISASDVLTQASSALNTYDPPTKAELDAAIENLDLGTPDGSSLRKNTGNAYTVSGSPVAGAEILIYATGSSQPIQRAFTDASGIYSVYLAPGTYTVVALLDRYNKIADTITATGTTETLSYA